MVGDKIWIHSTAELDCQFASRLNYMIGFCAGSACMLVKSIVLELADKNGG